jgi:hypothetical protein
MGSELLCCESRVLSESDAGDKPPGESRSCVEMLLMELPPTDKPPEDAYDPFRRPLDDVDDEIDPCCIGAKRLIGEPRLAVRWAVLR